MEFGVSDEEDQEECLDLIKRNDQKYELRVNKKRRTKFC